MLVYFFVFVCGCIDEQSVTSVASLGTGGDSVSLVSIDSTAQHGRHVFDVNCKICTTSSTMDAVDANFLAVADRIQRAKAAHLIESVATVSAVQSAKTPQHLVDVSSVCAASEISGTASNAQSSADKVEPASDKTTSCSVARSTVSTVSTLCVTTSCSAARSSVSTVSTLCVTTTSVASTLSVAAKNAPLVSAASSSTQRLASSAVSEQQAVFGAGKIKTVEDSVVEKSPASFTFTARKVQL
jgi:hypothetical protein